MRRFILLLLCLLLLTASAAAAGDQITSLTEEVTVDEYGAISVTATAEVSFPGGASSFVFPLGKGTQDITASGAAYDRQQLDGVDCIVFTSSAGFSGKQTFVCTYTLPSAVTETSIGQQFSFAPIARGFEYPIEKLTLRIAFPNDISARPAWSSAYYGDVIDNYLTIRVQDKHVEVTSAAAFKDHETLSMSLQFPPDAFTLRHLVGTTESVSRIAFYVLFALALAYWLLRLRGHFLLPKMQQTVDMEATAGELTTRLYGEPADIAATLAHWANLGYLTIRRNRNGRLLLQKQMDMGNERKSAERRLFAAVFRYGDICDASTERFRSVTRTAAAPLRGIWLRRIFKRKGGSPRVLRLLGMSAAVPVGLLAFDLLLPASWVRWVFLPLLTALCVWLSLWMQRGLSAMLRRRGTLLLGLAAALALLLLGIAAGCTGTMLLHLLLQTFCALTTLFGGKRTDEGEELVRRQLGLRRYLRGAADEELRRNAQLDGQYFYRTLPFAELLGVGSAFAKHFGSMRLEPCPWLLDAQEKPATAVEFYRLYAEIMAQLRGEEANKLARLLNLPKTAPPAATGGSKGT